MTGVQTCALPISLLVLYDGGVVEDEESEEEADGEVRRVFLKNRTMRSEERRVGKGVDLGGRRIIKKKK